MSSFRFGFYSSGESESRQSYDDEPVTPSPRTPREFKLKHFSDRSGSGSGASGKHLLERESSSLSTLVVLSTISIALELIRQLFSYAIKYSNDDEYPMPSSLLVFCVELGKFTFFFTKMATAGKLHTVNISFCYLIPSTLYAINNNIYFVALYFTTPPFWNILMQSRVLFTALTYRIYFRKPITRVQWLGLIILTVAIAILQFSGADSTIWTQGLSYNVMVALSLALVASMMSAIGPLYTEYLLKHDKRSFDDKQIQMYVFGMLVTGTMFLGHRYATADEFTPIFVIYGDLTMLGGLVVLCVGFTVLSGIVVAIIIKKLDNIVKLYTQAISNALTAVACHVFFPRTSNFDAIFILSLVMTIGAIYLYESKEMPCDRHGNASGNPSNSSGVGGNAIRSRVQSDSGARSGII